MRKMADDPAKGSSFGVQLSTADGDSIDVEFPKLFYVNNMEDVKEVIQNYEIRTRSQYAANRESKNFAANWSIFSALPKHRITWQDREGRYEKIPNDGIPFIVVGKRSMSCTFGPTYRSKAIENIRKSNEALGKKNRIVAQRSVNCPAQISIREIHKFPEFTLPQNQNTKHQREKLIRELKHDLIKQKAVGERRFYVSLPRMKDHRGHDFEKDVSKLRTDYRVTKKITDLIYRRVFDPQKLRELVVKYVRDELFKGRTAPPLTDARFYPPKRRILNISYNTRVKMQEEGIAVPIPLVPANGKSPRGRKLSQEKRTVLSPPSEQKKSKRTKVEVLLDDERVVVEVEVADEDEEEGDAFAVRPTDAAEMLLMLDQPARDAVAHMEVAGVEEVEFSSGAALADEEEEATAAGHGPPAEEARSVAFDSSEVVELRPEKQACLDLLERMKPLIVFASQSEPVVRLKETLERSIQDLEGCFG